MNYLLIIVLVSFLSIIFFAIRASFLKKPETTKKEDKPQTVYSLNDFEKLLQNYSEKKVEKKAEPTNTSQESTENQAKKENEEKHLEEKKENSNAENHNLALAQAIIIANVLNRKTE